MKSRMQTLLPAMALTALFFLAGCEKVYDYIHHHPVAEYKFCRIEKLKINVYGQYQEVKVSYDIHGNPVKISPPEGAYFNVENHFRYDKQQRLTDFYINFPDARGVLVWHRFSYPDKHTIVDSQFNYVGLIDDPVPPNHSDFGEEVNYYHLDDAGRIGTYDERGNLIRPDIVYDNKISIYRTNKIWMQVFRDYSVNNPIDIQNEIIKYNEFGLPVKFKSSPGPPDYSGVGSVLGCNYEEMEVEYSCNGKGAFDQSIGNGQ